MARRPKSDGDIPTPRRPRAKTPAQREQQLIELASDLAEKQMREGTASAMVITHYIKLATVRERLELEKLTTENALRQAQVESLQSMKRVEELYANALNAMRAYSGSDEDRDD